MTNRLIGSSAHRFIGVLLALCLLAGGLESISFPRIGAGMPSLTFGGATSNRVNHGALGSAQLSTVTVMQWIYPTTLTSGRRMWTKGSGSGDKRFRLSGTSGAIEVFCTRSTNVQFVSSSTPLSTTSKWYFAAVTIDQGATPVVHVYIGDLTTAISEVTSWTISNSGSGTFTDITAQDFVIGNVGSATFNSSFQGDIATTTVYNRVLTSAEIETHRMRPYCNSGDGCILFTHLGWAGTGTQPDLSGHLFNGTVTGATVAKHAPLARFP